ncbi:MAG: hypothetical protein M3O30_19400 [Planctomycetota bacterium]|nr:hypothetical protein [Planctomycetota bacterium]
MLRTPVAFFLEALFALAKDGVNAWVLRQDRVRIRVIAACAGIIRPEQNDLVDRRPAPDCFDDSFKTVVTHPEILLILGVFGISTNCASEVAANTIL